MTDSPTKQYLTRRQLRERYNCVDRTIARWIADPKLGFPRPFVIRERQFFDRADIEAFDASRGSTYEHKRMAA
jgi:hypothetical protein